MPRFYIYICINAKAFSKGSKVISKFHPIPRFCSDLNQLQK